MNLYLHVCPSVAAITVDDKFHAGEKGKIVETAEQVCFLSQQLYHFAKNRNILLSKGLHCLLFKLG